jgi:hypothetical protein
MSSNIIAGLVAFLLGFGLMGCANTIQKELFGCKQSPNSAYCPKK